MATEETIQTISWDHGGGESVVVQTVEEAQAKCPFLGKLTPEQAQRFLGIETTHTSDEEPVASATGELNVSPKTEDGRRSQQKEKPSWLLDKPQEEVLIASTAPEELSETLITVHNSETPYIQEQHSVTIKELQTEATDIVVETASSQLQPQLETVIYSEPSSKDSYEAGAVELQEDSPPTLLAEIAAPVAVPEAPVIAAVEASPVVEQHVTETHSNTEHALQPLDELLGNVTEETVITETEAVTPEPVSIKDIFPEELDEPSVLVVKESQSLLEADEDVPFVEVSQTLEVLFELLDNQDVGKDQGAAETFESSKAHELLREIVALPAIIETTVEISAADHEDIDVQLETLFVALFKELDIDYTPELVRAFVRITKNHYFEARIAQVEVQTEAGTSDDMSKEIGTRELLQKLQSSVHRLGQTLARQYRLGKSALLMSGLTSYSQST